MNDKIIKIPFSAKQAIADLDAESYFILHTIFYALEEPSDEAIMSITGFGLSRHRKNKKKLMDRGYLLIDQVGKADYKYTVGGLND